MRTFTLTIEIGRDGMRSPGDIAQALRDAADRIERDDLESGRVRDIVGNYVGRWRTGRMRNY